jgi:adenylate cyclase
MDNQNFKHRLAALLSADVVGYSRLMAEDELATIRTLSAYCAEMTALVRSNSGRVVNFVGDNMLAEFTSALDAVACALSIQRRLSRLNNKLDDSRRMSVRIGVNLGDVAVDGELIFGDGVNIAARLEALAEPGGICISDIVYGQIVNKLDFHSIDLGQQALKNIPGPVRVYRIDEPQSDTPAAAIPVAAAGHRTGPAGHEPGRYHGIALSDDGPNISAPKRPRQGPGRSRTGAAGPPRL